MLTEPISLNSEEKSMDTTSRWNAYLIFILGASFYLYEYILQVAPSVMSDTMMQSFGVDAAGFGIVTSLYFLAYAPMQLPAGILYDRYGPRRLMTFAILMCAFGSCFFALTNQLLTAGIGRILMGIGSAFSFIGIIILISRWFPPRHFAFLAGIAQLMSSLGAMFGQKPLAGLIELIGWRQASFLLAGVGILLSILIWMVVRDYPDKPLQQTPPRHLKDEWRRLHEVCRHSYTWYIALYSFCIWTPIAVFAALWSVPYLQQKFNIDVLTASGLSSMIWIGIGIGSPLLGAISDWFHSRRLALALSAAIGLLAALYVLYAPATSLYVMGLALFFFGFGAGGQTVSFAVINENNPHELVGSASGFNNFSVLLGGAIFQPFVGIFLHYMGEYTLQNGVPIYTVASYNQALIILPICFLMSFLMVIFAIKESHPTKKQL